MRSIYEALPEGAAKRLGMTVFNLPDFILVFFRDCTGKKASA